MILPSEEKFVLVQCNSKPISTHKGYCLKLFLLPLTSVPVSDYYVYDLIETTFYITDNNSFQSLVESQPTIQKIKNQCIGCAMDLGKDEILDDGIFSQYRNIHKLAEIYNKSNNEKNKEFFNSLHELCEKNIKEHFTRIIHSNSISNTDVVALNDCLSKSQKMDFDKRLNYLEELSSYAKTKLTPPHNTVVAEADF